MQRNRERQESRRPDSADQQMKRVGNAVADADRSFAVEAVPPCQAGDHPAAGDEQQPGRRAHHGEGGRTSANNAAAAKAAARQAERNCQTTPMRVCSPDHVDRALATGLERGHLGHRAGHQHQPGRAGYSAPSVRSGSPNRRASKVPGGLMGRPSTGPWSRLATGQATRRSKPARPNTSRHVE